MMTIPFNVAKTVLAALAKTSQAMRLVILEDPPSADVTNAENANRGKLAFSNGAILGKSFIKYKTSFGGAKVTPIPNSDLDKWFVDEELDRPTNKGHVFFVHAKVLIVDPLSDDPLVCSGSANFSSNSLTANDENMLLIRGDTRVADIYMTELDRIFRHFRARDIINTEAAKGEREQWLLLDTTDAWIGPNFQDGSYKNNRRLLFFPASPPKAWSAAAATDPNPFKDEAARAQNVRDTRNQKARDRKAGGGAAKTGKKTGAKTAKKNAKKSGPKKAAKKKATKKKATKKKATKKKASARKSAKPKKASRTRKAAGKTKKRAGKR
jgi:hypothetical protein